MYRFIALLLVALLGALPAAAQSAAPTAPRVLHESAYDAKGDDGQPIRVTNRLVYDPAAGTYTHTWTDANGAILKQTVETVAMVQPTPEEAETAEALVREHPEVAAAIAGARYEAVVAGGFPYTREAGHACGPGSRCVQYDVYQIIPGTKRGERLRYVVVDLRTNTVVDADLDPTWEGNLANPATRRASRARGVAFPNDGESR